jgi:hypothetical protein
MDHLDVPSHFEVFDVRSMISNKLTGAVLCEREENRGN